MDSLVTRKEGKIVLWPIYFDSNVSHGQGRRVSMATAVSNPKVEEISEALKNLGYSHRVEREVAHPARWWRSEGRVVLKKKQPKSKLIKWVGKRLKTERQGGKAAEEKSKKKNKKKR